MVKAGAPKNAEFQRITSLTERVLRPYHLDCSKKISEGERKMFNFTEHPYKQYVMPRYRITTKCRKESNGVRIEPGMSVEIVTSSMSNPVSTNGGKEVAAAFMRIYGIDLVKACALNMIYLECEKLD